MTEPIAEVIARVKRRSELLHEDNAGGHTANCQCVFCDATRLATALQEALRERDEALEALRTIYEYYGIVCTGFMTCHHEACQSSHGAWAIADNVLHPEAPEWIGERCDDCRVAECDWYATCQKGHPAPEGEEV